MSVPVNTHIDVYRHCVQFVDTVLCSRVDLSNTTLRISIRRDESRPEQRQIAVVPPLQDSFDHLLEFEPDDRDVATPGDALLDSLPGSSGFQEQVRKLTFHLESTEDFQ